MESLELETVMRNPQEIDRWECRELEISTWQKLDSDNR